MCLSGCLRFDLSVVTPHECVRWRGGVNFCCFKSASPVLDRPVSCLSSWSALQKKRGSVVQEAALSLSKTFPLMMTANALGKVRLLLGALATGPCALTLGKNYYVFARAPLIPVSVDLHHGLTEG